MLKTLEDLCPGQTPEDVLVDYAMFYFPDSDSKYWPAEVILAVEKLKHPGRTFTIDIDEKGVDLCKWSDVVDVAKELAALEVRVEQLKRELAHA